MREIIIEEQDDKEGLESLYVRRANYYETDKMGIIHHSNYIRWFEEARLHYMEEMGWPFTKVEAMGIIIPVPVSYTHLDVYKRQAYSLRGESG